MHCYYQNLKKACFTKADATLTRTGFLSKKKVVELFTDTRAISNVKTNNPTSIEKQCENMRKHNTRFAQCYVGGDIFEGDTESMELVGWITIQAIKHGDNEFMIVTPDGDRIPFEPVRERCVLVFKMAQYNGELRPSCEVRL